MTVDALPDRHGPGLQFASPASTSLDELVSLRSVADSIRRARRLRSRSTHTGATVSRRLGRGLDFAEVRGYQPGDDVRMIDWKVTARTGQAHTKLFVEEREQPVMLILDCRHGMRFGTRGMFKSVMAARLAAVLGWCAVASRDRVGGVVFADDWHAEVRPQAGRRGLMGLFRAIVDGQQRVPNPAASGLSEHLARLRRSVTSGSTAVLLSDFSGFDQSARSALGGLLPSVELRAVQIADPLERELPPGGDYFMVSTHPSERRRLRFRSGSRQQALDWAQDFDQRCDDIQRYFLGSNHRHVLAMTSDSLSDRAAAVLSPDRPPSGRRG